MTPWDGAKIPWQAPPTRWYNWPLAILRIFLIAAVTLILFVVVVFVQLLQKIIGRHHLEIGVQRLWARLFLAIAGVRLQVDGKCAGFGGAVICNHASWLDIIIISATSGGYFVSKAEIRDWPIAGPIARLLRTEFLIRDRKYTKTQVENLQRRYEAGDHIVFFPEGTTSDGLTVLPFKSSLFESLADENHAPLIQPMTIFYQAPKGASANYYGLWGNMNTGVHALSVMKIWNRRPVRVVFDAPIGAPWERRSLTDRAEKVISKRHLALMQEAEGNDH